MPFYSMRDAAAFFGVSSRTMATIYERLESEGLLTRVRSSQTILPGRKLQSRHPVRGVVGIAIALRSFIYGTGLRSFYIRLEEELRRQHFVADFIFYQQEDELEHPAELAERLLEHQLDFLFWVAPLETAVPVIQRLRDGGIQLVIVGDGKARYPREQYFVDLGRGIADGLTAWLKDGINSVVVLLPGTRCERREIEVVCRFLQRRRIRYEMIALPDAEAARRLTQLASKSGTGVIFFPYKWYESLCNQFPQTMEKLFQSRRAMLVQGVVAHEYFRGKPVFADGVTWPYNQMAKRIARDISARKIDTTERLATFHTLWEPRVDLGKVNKEIETHTSVQGPG